jgi:hypothetical protein
LLQDAGLFGPLSQITDDYKRNILAHDYAHGIDIAATKLAIANDGFSQARRADPAPTTTASISGLASRDMLLSLSRSAV